MFSLQTHSQPVRRQRHAWHEIVLSEDLLAAALDREFKRADRLDEALALLVVRPDAPCDDAAWQEVIGAMLTVKRPTDVLGWLTNGCSLAIIRSLPPLPADAAGTIGATLQQDFVHALNCARTPACLVQTEIFSSDSDATPPSRRSRARREVLTEAIAGASKRTLDIAGAVTLLALLAPVLLVVSGLVRFSSRGPVLFRQTRVGHNGQPFTMLKFRTMHTNSDEAVHEQYVTQFIQAGSVGTSESGVFKIVNDRRVTPVGHFLRRSSLDELPQFWNVLRGEMSLVGPRPPLPYEVARYKRWHRRRLSAAKPGITGLWQVTARSRATFDEMVRLDLQYARNPSLWTDIRILLATPRAVFSGKGAH